MSCTFLAAQKHDYVWRHGNGDHAQGNYVFTINFKQFPPLIEPTESKSNFDNSGINIADNEGSTTFFSDGCSLFIRSGDIMPGGEVINPGPVFNAYCKKGYPYPLFHGMFVLPRTDSLYEVFHQRQGVSPLIDCQYPDLLHTQVDMKANGGEGAVTTANEQFFSGCLQTLSANRHANGRDWWLLVANNQADVFFRFLLTTEGIKGPWEQAIANPAKEITHNPGWSDFSPNGEMYSICGAEGMAVYNFDRCSGLLSNTRFIPNLSQESAYLSAVFSPNNRFIYASLSWVNRIDQFDLTAPNLASSRKTIAVWDSTYDEFHTPIVFAYLQHGPDGKIYAWSGTRYMHVIDDPDKAGPDCRFRQKAIILPSNTFGANFYYPHYRLGPLDNSSCDTLGLNNLPHAEYRYDLADSTQALALQFTDVSWYEPDHWHWDFGDPASGSSNSSMEQNPVHTFSMSGIYTVCLIASNQYAADTICKQVKVGISSAYTLPALPQAQVYPNPVADALKVRLPAMLPGHALRFALTDALGRTVRELALTDFETEVDVAGLPKGMYFWRVTVGCEVLQAGKAVKM